MLWPRFRINRWSSYSVMTIYSIMGICQSHKSVPVCERWPTTTATNFTGLLYIIRYFCTQYFAEKLDKHSDENKWSIIFGTAVVTQFLKELYSFYGDRIYIPVITILQHWSSSKRRCLQPYFLCFKLRFNIVFTFVPKQVKSPFFS